MNKIRRKIYNISKKTGDKFGFDLPYFVENGFWAISSQTVNLISSLVVSLFLARYLSKETFGQYQLVLSFIGVFAIFSLPGLNVSIARSVARGYDYSYAKAYKMAFKASFFSIPFFIVIAVWYHHRMEQVLGYTVLLSAILFPFIYGFNKWVSLLKGKALFEKIAKIQMLQNLSSALVLIGLVYFFPNNLILTIGFLLGMQVVFSLLGHFVGLKYIKTDKIDPECIPYGMYITKISLLNIVLNNFDKLIIGFLDLKLLAVYAVSLKILDIIKGFLKSLYSISFPKFAKKNMPIKGKVILMLFLAGAISALFLYYVSESFINFLYTDKYADSATLFNKFVFLIPLLFVNPLLAVKMTAGQNKNKFFYVRVIVPLVSIVLSVMVFILSGNPEYFILSKMYSLNILIFLILAPWFVKD